ncbi:energy-coupling factor transporter transmembrane protein EcfT [Shimia litoralis]|uniref:Energy-coupling factor transporter transmembrane protein EcfT n=1 Tax=Shimia litoralis TaxID=420403 RepID=A0A4U7N884_9RHOB|nr:energy-coupling factor transporter transmembrane protein EcfT [Shimia litoralis]TKZ22169.1 energy-coupling factor transporter transmembrane protein EcfT [Shimia litoralis]
MLDLYSPGHSPIHKLSPGVKILAMMVGGTGLFLVENLGIVAVALAAVIALYKIAGLSATQVWNQIRPVLWILIFFLGLQWWLAGASVAVFVVLRLATLLLLAGLVTLTTRASDMIESLTSGLRFLRPLGVNPAKVGLAISLALRFIPVLAQITTEVREAQKARGMEHSIVAVAMPVAIRMLKMADDISDAIDARGYRP